MNTHTRWGAIALLGALASAGCSRSQSNAGVGSPVSASAGDTAAPAEEELRRVSIDELAGLIERHETVAIIDNNGREMYERGHVPGARWVGHDAVTAEVLPADRNARLVFYCANEH